MSVSLTLSDSGTISDITAASESETPDFWAKAVNILDIIKGQNDTDGLIEKLENKEIDAVTGATPLSSEFAGQVDYLQAFLGQIGGSIGEVSKLALIIGAAYLLARRVISWRIPTAMIGTAFVCFWINSGSLYSADTASALYQLLSGGLILGAFFMATDYSSSPVTPVGQLIFGAGCGLLLFVIRMFNPTYPEGCSYAILFMNLLTPLIDRWTMPRIYGRGKKHA